MGLLWNPLYWVFTLPALLLALYAQWRVRSSYNKYLQVPNARGVSGVEAAQRLMRTAGFHVNVEGTSGQLSDHYDPRKKVLRLSESVARRSSVASVAIVAHEMGHAEQDFKAFALLRLRSGLVPIVNFTSWLGPLLFMVGILFNSPGLAWVGVIAFAGAVLFSLVTLPVELNASRRGLRLLEESGIIVNEKEKRGAKQVLNAAALTYVAALAQSLSTLLYYVFILSGGRRRRS
ncbi:MAG: zinc metallopeptidase [Anaerolineales bacterium]